MPNNVPIRGGESILSVWDGVDLAWEPVACLSSFELTPSRNVIESNTKCDPDEVVKTAGALSYQLTFEGELNDSTTGAGNTAIKSWDDLIVLMLANTAVEWQVSTGVPALSYFGDAIITELPLTSPAGDELITFSGTFDGNGTFTTTDPHP